MADLVEKLSDDPQTFAKTFYTKENYNILSPYLSNDQLEKNTIVRVIERLEIRYFPVNSQDLSVTSVSGKNVYNQLRMDPFTNNFVINKIVKGPLIRASIVTELMYPEGYTTPLITVLGEEEYQDSLTTLDQLDIPALDRYRQIKSFEEDRLVYPDEDYQNTAANRKGDPYGTNEPDIYNYTRSVMSEEFIDRILGQVLNSLKSLEELGFNHWYLLPKSIKLGKDLKIEITDLYSAGITIDTKDGPTRLYSGYGIDFAIQQYVYSNNLKTYRLPDNWSFNRYQSYVRSGKPGPSTLDWYVFLLGWLQQPEIFPVFFTSKRLRDTYWTPWWLSAEEGKVRYRLFQQVERYQVPDVSVTLGLIVGFQLKSRF